MQSIVPHDNTLLPGMKTVMGDSRESFPVTYIPDIEYVRRGHMALRLQLIMPHALRPVELLPPSGKTEGSPRFPLVIYVQGAAWGEQDVYSRIGQLSALARRGYVIASVKHRASDVAGFPAFLQDVKSAIRFMRAHADLYRIDPERVAIWGDSSGGHAALMTGVTGDMPAFKTEDNAGYSDAVCAVVDFYGPTDVTRINDVPRDPQVTADKDHIPEDILYGGCVAEHPEISQPGNPLNYVTPEKKLPPIMIAHGDMDPVVPFNQSVLMYEKLRACGQPVEFYKVFGAGHGTCFWTREMLENVAAFLEACM